MKMKIQVRDHQGELSDTLCAYIERRLHFAIGRFARCIDTVTVTLEDLNGPRGGVDKQCRITAILVTAGRLRVEATASEITPAVDQAANRIGRAISRECERHHPYPTYRPSVARITGSRLFQRQERTSRPPAA